MSSVQETELGQLLCGNLLHKLQVLIHNKGVWPSMTSSDCVVFECRNWYTSLHCTHVITGNKAETL